MSTEARPTRPADSRSFWQQQYDEATPGSMEQWRASAMGCMEAMGNCVTRATNAERDARHWREECGKVHAKADIMEDRWRTAESKLAAAREALEKIASGTVYNPSKLAADTLAQLRESGAGRATMDVSAAREMRVCRICREPMDTALGPKGALIFDFGREYAHEKCLVGVQSPPTEAMAKRPTCANLPPDQRRFASCGCGKGDDMEAAAREFYTRGDMMLTPIQALAAFAAQQYPHAEHDRLFYLEVSKVLTELCGDWNDDEDAPNRTNAVKAIRSLAQQTATLRAENERLNAREAELVRTMNICGAESHNRLKFIEAVGAAVGVKYPSECRDEVLSKVQQLATRFTADEIEEWLLAYHSQTSNDRVGMTQFIRTKIKERAALALGQEGGAKP